MKSLTPHLQTAGEKKPPLQGGFFVSLRLRLGLSTSHRQYWRKVMLLIFAHPRKVIFEPHDQIAEKSFLVDSEAMMLAEIPIYKSSLPFCQRTPVDQVKMPSLYASAAVRFGWWHNRFMPSDTVLHPCRMMPRRGLNRPPHRQYWRIC